jgi:hypothetical protein
MWVYEQWEIATDNLGDELKNELTEAREKIVDLWSDVIDSLQGQIDSMIFSTDNQADAAERLALMQDKIFGMTGGDISTYIAGFETASEKVGAVEELQGLLSDYLSLAQETYQRPSNEYAAIYEDVLSQLTELQNISTGYRTQEQVLLDQLGVLTDIRDLIAEESLLGGYATGTSYVPETGPYMLHRGEAVVPANRNYDSPAVKNEVSFKIEINGATNPGATGKAVRKELESFMRSPVGRKLIQTTSAGKA